MPAPINSFPPAVSVSSGVIANTGCVLSCSQGVWLNNPTSFAFQWKRQLISTGALSDIPGAIQQTYTTTNFDYGYQLVCQVTASNTSGSANALSSVSAMVGSQTTPPFAVPPITFPVVEYGLIQYSPPLLTAPITFRNTQLAGMAAAGAKWVRAEIFWDVVQPTAPGAADKTDPNAAANNFNWTLVDALVSACSTAQLKLLPVITRCPGWAVPVGATGPQYPPSNVQDYANFVTALVRRYSSLTALELWDSPNSSSSWFQDPGLGYPTPSTGLAGTDPVRYSQLVIATFNTVRGFSSIPIVFGGLAPAADGSGSLSPVTFLTQCYNNGALGRFDALGYKPFTNPAPPLETIPNNAFYQARKVYELMLARGEPPTKKIWATSAGFTTYSGTNTADGNTPEIQAQFTSDLMNGWEAYPFAGPLFYFHYQDTQPSNLDPSITSFGLLDYQGTQKPAYSVFHSIAVAASTQRTGRRMGMTIDNLMNHVGQGTLPGGGNASDLAQQEINALYKSGVDVVRFQLNWSDVAPVRPVAPTSPSDSAYNWAAVDAIYTYTRSLSLKVLPCIVNTPAWAGPNVNGPPTAAADYANFCAAFVSRVKAQYPSMTIAVEIWNEPNNPTYWVNPSPAAYAVLLKAAYTSIKAIDRTMFVLAGGMYPGQWNKLIQFETGHGTDSQTVTTSTLPPVITWQAPLNNATISGSSVGLNVTVTDPDSPPPATVDYWLQTGTVAAPIKTGVPSGPFGYLTTWDSTTVADGAYELHAIATDSQDSRIQTNTKINVTIANASAFPYSNHEMGFAAPPWAVYEIPNGINGGNATYLQRLAYFTDVGAKWIRFDMCPTASRLAEMDAMVNAANAAGLRIIATAVQNSGGAAAFTTGSGIATWVQTVLNRYPGKIHALEIGNEMNAGNQDPNYSGQSGAPAPGAFAPIMQAAYNAARAIDPTVQVLIGGIAAHDVSTGGLRPDTWMQQFMANAVNFKGSDGKFPFHGCAYHPYLDTTTATTDPVTASGTITGGINGVKAVHNAMIAGGHPTGWIWVTEFGYATTSSRVSGTYVAGTSGFVQGMITAWRGLNYTGPFCWFTLSGQSGGATNTEYTFGVFTTSDTGVNIPSMVKRPVYNDLKTMAHS